MHGRWRLHCASLAARVNGSIVARTYLCRTSRTTLLGILLKTVARMDSIDAGDGCVRRSRNSSLNAVGSIWIEVWDSFRFRSNCDYWTRLGNCLVCMNCSVVAFSTLDSVKRGCTYDLCFSEDISKPNVSMSLASDGQQHHSCVESSHWSNLV